MSFSVSVADGTRTVYATARKALVDYEGRISQQNTKCQDGLDPNTSCGFTSFYHLNENS